VVRRAEQLKFDVIVVGAGMAGSSAAAIAARAGLKVALIERGQAPGGKNYFGGAVYTHALLEIYPDFFDRKPPLERPVTEAGFWFLTKDGATRLNVQGGHLDNKPVDAYVALRAKFDSWWAEQAQKEGALLIPKTVVVDFLRDETGRVNGVMADRPQGEVHAPVTIICEGVNNLLTQKLGLIHHDLTPSRVALGVKQLISIPADTINTRFGFADKTHGLAVSVIGDVSLGLPGLGFIYTGEEFLSVGLGINLDVLAEYRLKPYEVLKRYLSHPAIAPLVAGGKLMEYGAHLIPEGGWQDMPRLSTDGVLVAGDAAAMVNALHWEGTNMAIVAGKLAAETAIQAHRAKDFSAKALSQYKEALQQRFVLRDLRQYRNFSRFLHTHPTFMSVYPNFVNETFGRFFTAYGKPKKQLYKEILGSLTSRRPLYRAAGDMISFARAMMGW
jgi:electron transfer flavoprotein-quinone oxidoreductase